MKVFGIIAEQPERIFERSGEPRLAKGEFSIRIFSAIESEDGTLIDPTFFNVGIRNSTQLTQLRDAINNYLTHAGKKDAELR